MLLLLLYIFLAAVIIGLLVWAVTSLSFIDANIKQIVRVAGVVIFCLVLLALIFGGVDLPAPRGLLR